jgi:hypothetical protein
VFSTQFLHESIGLPLVLLDFHAVDVSIVEPAVIVLQILEQWEL